MGKDLLETMFDEEYIEEEETKDIEEELSEEELKELRNKKFRDIIESTVNDIEEFDSNSWKKGVGYLSKKFPTITDKLEGLDSGLYLLAAESNVGKSALLLELVEDISKNIDNNLFGLYFSLDDSKEEILPRIIAKNKQIPIGVASKPSRIKELIDSEDPNKKNYQHQLEKREEGVKELIESAKYFKVYDSNDIKYIEDIQEEIEKMQILIKSIDPDSNLIVAIDSINDLRFRDKTFHSDRSKHDEAAQLVKDWTVLYNIPIFASTHLMKDGSGKNARPTIGRIKESVEYVYEASVIWMLYNDVGLNGQSANIYYSKEGTTEKFPVVEMDWAKNKKSSFKGRTFLYMSPEMSYLEEVDAEANERYNSMVYEG